MMLLPRRCVMKCIQIQLATGRPLVSFALFCIGFGFLAAGRAEATYGTEGFLSMNSAGGSSITRQVPFAPQVEISDSDSTTGTNGAVGTGSYTASLSGGAVTTSSSAQNPTSGTLWFATATLETSFREDLTFTLPPGTYPSGLYATSYIYVEASVSASGDAVAQNEYLFGFGEVEHVTMNTPAPPVSTILELTVELASPGLVLNSPVQRTRRLDASARSAASAQGPDPGSATASISGRVLCVEAPAGVTWVSDSGVFPTACLPVATPTLSRWPLVLLITLLVGSAVWLARKGSSGRFRNT